MSHHDFFRGRTLVIATMHGKEAVIAPLVEQSLGVRTILPPSIFNSDVFGTFTGDIKRTHDQLETARKKAYAAMETTGLDLAIANEGSFGPDPNLPGIVVDQELCLLIDKANHIEVAGWYRTAKTNAAQTTVGSAKEALAFARSIGFPAHGIIVRRTARSRFFLYKDIADESSLLHRVNSLLSYPFVRQIVLETDLRAHRNPTRLDAIRNATEILLENSSLLCPRCGAPGFTVQEEERGLPCRRCGLPTSLVKARTSTCQSCHFRHRAEVTTEAEPRDCAYCNP